MPGQMGTDLPQFSSISCYSLLEYWHRTARRTKMCTVEWYRYQTCFDLPSRKAFTQPTLANGKAWLSSMVSCTDCGKPQLILPKALRPKVLQQLHHLPTSGHLVVAKTLGRVRERFYWIQSDVMYRTGAETVMSVHREEALKREPELPWESTMLVPQWSALLWIFLASLVPRLSPHPDEK